ncbi:hypothetical protein F5Y00DRAFT_271371 [Daldinia vernicosa]|uniref:uncharacterized protein n=1 Tax=Daldinia vernicosa TaxID=114800 RepID=UPI002007A795|nr:uncharacterized protein F5Y00DRAFT_271371 [Daldinia vernicosa]KAI0847067.1 hypothetical protein F5Y00DRAFT_271371 [Daldinia vernicosa]
MDYVQDIRRDGTLPYPNLIQSYATANQHHFFLEPEKPTREGGAGKQYQTAIEASIENSIKFRFTNFGSTTHVYRKDRAGKGSHFITFYRRDRGDFDHGLARSNEDIYECAKMNILRHPLRDDFNNPDYASEQRPPISNLVKALIRLNIYPAIPNAVMCAPLLPRCGPISSTPEEGRKPGQFSKPKHTQPTALTSVFEIPELCMAIMLEIGHRWGDLSNLSRTCQTIMFALNAISTRVDVLSGNFLNLEFSDAEIDKANAKLNGEELELGKFIKPPSPQFLVLSNVRPPYKAPEDGEDKPNSFGFPARPKGKISRPTAERRVIDTYRFLRTIDVRGHHIKILHLHSVPNFDIALLKMCLERLPNLEILGVYNCVLLHFGETVEFLKAIIAHNKKPGNKFVRSDFSPVYYPGLPVGSEGRTGEYGVIPSDQGLIDTRRAIVAVLRNVVSLALKNGIDWFTPGAAMRQYLERIPFALGTLRYILEACYNIYYHEHGLYYPFIKDVLKRGITFDNNEPRHESMRCTVYNDLILATEGKPMQRDRLVALTMSAGFHKLIICAFCATPLPAYFFTEESINRRSDQVECCGCQLGTQLEHHVDNFFQERKGVMHFLFDDEQITDIHSFLNAKRTATPAELRNSKFDFWLISVKSREEVLAARPDDADAIILDGRPGPSHDEEAKQIWVWKERVAKAMRYAKRNIDEGLKKSMETIADCEKDIGILNDLYYNGHLQNAYEIRQNRNTVDSIERYIEQERARCGLAQMRGKFGTTLAANWDDEIKKYREIVQINTGLIKNHGPRHVWETRGGIF